MEMGLHDMTENQLESLMLHHYVAKRISVLQNLTRYEQIDYIKNAIELCFYPLIIDLSYLWSFLLVVLSAHLQLASL